MKQRPKDLLDVLAGKDDKVAKVNELKASLKGYKDSLTFRVQRRKLGDIKKEKLYFYAEAIGAQYINTNETMWGGPFRSFMLNSVRNHFPRARVTSAGTYNVTIAEY